MNKLFFLRVSCLVVMIIGNFFFLISMIYFNQDLLIVSLSQMMSGSVGFFLLDTQKVPHSLYTKKGVK